MLCQNCARKEATTHIRGIFAGETTQTHLCAECAAALGYTDTFPEIHRRGADMPDTGRRGEAVAGKSLRCETCGCSFEDIAESGAPGCPDCYRIFYDRLLPTIQRLHGKTSHIGKVPAGADEGVKRARAVMLLKEKLNRAIDERNFGMASLLRDEIRETEGRKHG